MNGMRDSLGLQINNHLTAAIPGSRDQFLVFPFGLLWSEVTASSLLVVDSEGKVIRGKGQPEATAFYVHAVSHSHIIIWLSLHILGSSSKAVMMTQDIIPKHQNNYILLSFLHLPEIQDWQ